MDNFTNLSPLEQVHIRIMSAIAKSVCDTPMILKGGTALLLAYGLDRFSEDLDFDSTKAIQLPHRIAKAVSPIAKITALDVVKDTATVSRYRMIYEAKEGKGRLKIETSFREIPPAYKSILINGIKVYDISSLIDQKLQAVSARTTARDLYDIHFLATSYPQEFNDKQSQQLDHLSSDLTSLESRFSKAFEIDNLLQNTEFDNLLLSLQSASQHILETKLQKEVVNTMPSNKNCFSYDRAKSDIYAEFGQEIKIYDANVKEGHYRGQIILNSDKYVGQRLGANIFVLHDKNQLEGNFTRGKFVNIQYKDQKVISVEIGKVQEKGREQDIKR